MNEDKFTHRSDALEPNTVENGMAEDQSADFLDEPIDAIRGKASKIISRDSSQVIPTIPQERAVTMATEGVVEQVSKSELSELGEEQEQTEQEQED